MKKYFYFFRSFLLLSTIICSCKRNDSSYVTPAVTKQDLIGYWEFRSYIGTPSTFIDDITRLSDDLIFKNDEALYVRDNNALNIYDLNSNVLTITPTQTSFHKFSMNAKLSNDTLTLKGNNIVSEALNPYISSAKYSFTLVYIKK